jgi:nickel-dependent lactate racemase
MDTAHTTTVTVQYGANSTLNVEFDSDALLAEFSSPQGSVLADTSAGIRHALRNPMNGPPLSRWTTPGDRVSLVVEEAMPAAHVAIQAAVQELIEAGVRPDHISVLLSSSYRANPLQLTAALPDQLQREVRMIVHDPHDPRQLEFLAVGDDQQPIYLSRTLCDADLVIPIGSLKADASYGFMGVAGQVYPSFSDVPTRRRFQSPDRSASGRQQKRLRSQAEQVLWLLGPAFTLQTVAAGGDRLLAALAGPIEDVERAGVRIFEEAWTFPLDRRADLVIAGLSLGSGQQSWSNLARGLNTALNAVEEGGAVVLCTDWDLAPGPALQKLASADSIESAETILRRNRSADSIVAQLLVEALQRVRVLLFSQLPASTVEQLGMGAITAVEQITRLAKQYSRCIVLGHAQLAELSIATQSDAN